MDSLLAHFSGDNLMPHGHCYLWKPALVWSQRISNLTIELTDMAVASVGIVVLRKDEQLRKASEVEVMEPQVRQRGFESSDEVDRLGTDRRLLRQILANLVANALRYTDEGHIALSIEQTDDHHYLSVRDTGPGVAAAERVRLFEPFERGEDARQRQLPGAGVGLALVRDLVEALAGHVELDSEAGVGSTVTVVLPSGGNADFAGNTSHE